MSELHPDEPSQQQLDEESAAEIQDRKRRALALLREWMAEAEEEDEKMWPLAEEEFNLL